MGGAPSTPLPRPAVPEGKIRICITGFSLSPNSGKAAEVTRAIVAEYPEKYESWFYFDMQFRGDGTGQNGFLGDVKKELSSEQQEKFAKHKTSPFCWLEHPDGTKDAKGGCDFFSEWALAEFSGNEKIKAVAAPPPSISQTTFSKEPGTAKTN